MITLIVGTPNSGKSVLAESIAMEQAKEKKYYVATMIPFGEEGKKRVEKHRKMRAGKGFITLEWPENMDQRMTTIDFSHATVLLECMSNLIGNEMHSKENKNRNEAALKAKIIASIRKLSNVAENLILVTNEFPSQEERYDEDTKRYVRLVAEVNKELITIADQVFSYIDGKWCQYENC